MIQLQNLTFDLNTNLIFEDINCTIQDNDRVGIIGRNGAGKSTLLKMIAGKLTPTSGSVHIQRDSRIAYLPQEEILNSPLTVFDEAFSAFSEMVVTEQKIHEIDEAIGNGTCTDEQLEEYAALHEIMRQWNKEESIQQTKDVLAGLGFTPATIQKNVSELSTGWKMRLALAKLLLTDADMYLFDEPTNHLDIVTQQWFLEKLQSMKQGFMLVSHDQVYLEKVCTSILEIERGEGTYYRGNLQSYLRAKEERIELAKRTRARQERDIAHKQTIIEKFRASATKARQAQSLMKKIDRIELVEVEPPLPTIKFQFPSPPKPGNIILTFHNLSYAFGQQPPVFQNASGEIQRGERVAIVAANGVGKSTLLNCIMGTYTPTSGYAKFGHNVQTAFFAQDQARTLHPDKTVFNEVSDACPKISTSEIRAVLGAFQFSGDDVDKKINVLSGGEKNRVAMAKVLLQRANFLILDEPTNHLDLYAKDVLRQALASYEGTILFVTHDLTFINKLATRIIELTPNDAHSYPGTYEEFCVAKKLAHVANSKVTTPIQVNSKKKEKNPEHRELYKEIQSLERSINKLEHEEKREVELLGRCEYGSNEYSKSLKKLTETQEKLKKVQMEWEEKMDDAGRNP